MIRPSESGEPGTVFVRAWIADDRGRLDSKRPMGHASFDDEGIQLPSDIWYSSKETGRLYELPEEVREGIWEYDDVIRAQLKRRAANARRDTDAAELEGYTANERPIIEAGREWLGLE